MKKGAPVNDTTPTNAQDQQLRDWEEANKDPELGKQAAAILGNPSIEQVSVMSSDDPSKLNKDDIPTASPANSPEEGGGEGKKKRKHKIVELEGISTEAQQLQKELGGVRGVVSERDTQIANLEEEIIDLKERNQNLSDQLEDTKDIEKQLRELIESKGYRIEEKEIEEEDE